MVRRHQGRRACGATPRLEQATLAPSRSRGTRYNNRVRPMTRRVLVVDDDAAILEVLEMRLGAMGLAVSATSDPLAAVSAVESTRFDLALLDLRMEPMDGIRLMEALRERQPRLPVLIM